MLKQVSWKRSAKAEEKQEKEDKTVREKNLKKLQQLLLEENRSNWKKQAPTKEWDSSLVE